MLLSHAFYSVARADGSMNRLVKPVISLHTCGSKRRMCVASLLTHSAAPNELQAESLHSVIRTKFSDVWLSLCISCASMQSAWTSKTRSVVTNVCTRLSTQSPSATTASTEDTTIQQPVTNSSSVLLPFLQAADAIEVTHTALLSDLSNAAYGLDTDAFYRTITQHALLLVTTSNACSLMNASKLPPPPPPRSPSHHTSQHAFNLAVGGFCDPFSPDQCCNEIQCEIEELLASCTSTCPGSKHTSPANYDVNSNALNAELVSSISEVAVVAVTAAADMHCASDGPTAWFVADDPVTRTRYIAIQGSTTMDHWNINIQFDPVVFEHDMLGTRIHHGVYDAALKLYDDILPLVQEHLRSHPHASICLTGHSLGGSLATALTCMLVFRGVLPVSAVAPVYTFGAPAIFCQGAGTTDKQSTCTSCKLACEHAGPHTDAHACSTAVGCSSRKGLLASLGLSDRHVSNIIMHNDIVPRAFVCDYTLVVGLLHSWNPAFKGLPSLSTPQHTTASLYGFIGRLSVIQPDTSLPFIHPYHDSAHPMLPRDPALYTITEPLQAHATHTHFSLSPSSSSSPLSDLLPAITFNTTTSTARTTSPAACSSTPASSSSGGAVPNGDMQRAVAQFMNTPHPLTTLSEVAAYGPNGSISRYHNPDNYTKALLGVLALQ